VALRVVLHSRGAEAERRGTRVDLEEMVMVISDATEHRSSTNVFLGRWDESLIPKMAAVLVSRIVRTANERTLEMLLENIP